jgi:hypothetical protein
MTQNAKNQMRMLAEVGGIRIETWNECQLWAVPNDETIEWYMLGNTGTHRIIENYLDIIWPTERVIAHWKAFVRNQNN